MENENTFELLGSKMGEEGISIALSHLAGVSEAGLAMVHLLRNLEDLGLSGIEIDSVENGTIAVTIRTRSYPKGIVVRGPHKVGRTTHVLAMLSIEDEGDEEGMGDDADVSISINSLGKGSLTVHDIHVDDLDDLGIDSSLVRGKGN